MMSAIAMTLMLVASLSCFAYLMIPRTKVLLNLQPDARFDQVGERIKSVVKFAIGQWRMPREPIAGFAHIMIFSGFMVVALGTVLHIAHAYAGELVDSFYLNTGFGKLYAFIKDIFEFLVIIGVSLRNLASTEANTLAGWSFRRRCLRLVHDHDADAYRLPRLRRRFDSVRSR